MKGIYTALITPFDSNDKIDYNAYKKLLQLQIEAKVDGVIPCGTTGESTTLSLEEKKELILFTIEELKQSSIQVIAGTGSNSTKESIALSQWADQAGVHGVILVTPYYNKPTQQGIIEHIEAIAHSVHCPIVLYNVPGRTVVSMTPQTMTQLAKNPLIRTVKEASGQLAFISEIQASLDASQREMDILTGDDPTFLASLAVGAAGNISVASNLIPKVIVSIYRLFQDQKIEAATQLHRKFYPLFRDLFIETNPIPIKYALSQVHGFSEKLRLPLTTLTKENQDKIMKRLKECEVETYL